MSGRVIKSVAKMEVKAAPKMAKSPAAKPVPAPKTTNAAKPKKAKLVQDSFTMPDAEYVLFAEVKQRCLAGGVAAKKSQVLRAVFLSFAAKSDATLFKAIKALTWEIPAAATVSAAKFFVLREFDDENWHDANWH